MKIFRPLAALLATVAVFLFLASAFSEAEAARYVEGEALVVLRNSTGGALSASSLSGGAGAGYVRRVAEAAGAEAVRTYSAVSEVRNKVIVHMKSSTQTTEELIDALYEDPDVLSAMPNYIRKTFKEPDDPDYSQLWGMKAIRAEEAWDINTGGATASGEKVYAAIMDTGVYLAHEDLQDVVDKTYSRNFATQSGQPDMDVSDALGHGTHVTGTVAAVGNNRIGVAGVNWNAPVIFLKIFDDDTGEASTAAEMYAIDYLTTLLRRNTSMRVPAVNMSFGGWEPTTPEEYAKDGAYFEVYKALDDLNRVVIVVAAGNEGLEVGAPAPAHNDEGITEGWYVYPASLGRFLNNMIVVGATASDNTAAEFSNWSDKYVDVAAPGVWIWSTMLPTDEYNTDHELYGYKHGTSMATPHVTGAVALLAAEHPGEDAPRLKARVLQNTDTSVNPPVASGTTLSANGLINLAQAMTAQAPMVITSDSGVTPEALTYVTPGEQISRTYEVPDSSLEIETVSGTPSDFKTVPGDAKITATFSLSSGDVFSYIVRATSLSTAAATGTSTQLWQTFTVPTPTPTPRPDSDVGCYAVSLGAGGVVALLLALALRGKRGMWALLFALGLSFSVVIPAAFAETYVDGTALVVLRNKTAEAVSAASLPNSAGYVRSTAAAAGAKVVHTFASVSQVRNKIIVLMKSPKTTEALIASLKTNPDVLAASPIRVIEAVDVQPSEVAPDDPYYKDGRLWGMKRINADGAWDVTTGDSEIRVAVIDSGIYVDHPDLAGVVDTELSLNFVYDSGDLLISVDSEGEYFVDPDDHYADSNGHGTHVSGTIAAVGNNGLGVVGVNWNTKVIALRMLGTTGRGDWRALYASLDYIVWLLLNDPALRIPAVNMSIGGFSDTLDDASLEFFKALDDLDSTVMVIAASNNCMEVGVPAPVTIDDPHQYGLYVEKGWYQYPSSLGQLLKNAIVVGALASNDKAAYFTNWSEKCVDIAAPGMEIWSTIPPEVYENPSSNVFYVPFQGTSMAAPHVAGSVALLAAAYPGTTASQLKSRILNSANANVNPEVNGYYEFYDRSKKVTIPHSSNVSGYTVSAHGLLDLEAAMKAYFAQTPSDCKLEYEQDANGVKVSVFVPLLPGADGAKLKDVSVDVTGIASFVSPPDWELVGVGDQQISGAASDPGLMVTFGVPSAAELNKGSLDSITYTLKDGKGYTQAYSRPLEFSDMKDTGRRSSSGGCEVAGVFSLAFSLPFAAVALLALRRSRCGGL
ncbi:MAG: S8 family serine peptidase [Synergistaceae bacterium]|jgi:subtilisin family serine protease|nr:S8 family serine peptidase [Synergistaceae bacterium]